MLLTEYISGLAKKLNYSFHYQKQDASLIFRYDNARHKPEIDASGHKHLPDGKVSAAEPPLLKDIFAEIMGLLL